MATSTEILECGHTESPHSDFSRGYGTDKAGRRSCYDCCAEGDRRAMLTGGPFQAYVSSDGKTLTNWPGSILGTVTYLRRRDGTRSQYGEYLYTIQARDVHGQRWYGTGGGQGMWVTLRKYKNQ